MSTASDGKGMPMAEINVTPLIDVMLVLLIIFMINVPTLTHKVQIDLPQPNPNVTNPPEEADSITVRIEADGRVLWNDNAMTMDQVQYYMNQAGQQRPQPQIMLSVSDQSRYQVLAGVMARAKNAEITKIGFDGSER